MGPAVVLGQDFTEGAGSSGGGRLTSPDEWVPAIDFGTTNTVAAVTEASGTKILMVDERPVTPSAIFLNPDGKTWVVGDSAVRVGWRGPEWFEPNPRRWVPVGTLRLGDQEIPVGAAITAVLRPIVQEAASQHGGRRPSAFVVTLPAHWGDPRVAVLVEAAEHGWPKPAALSEPVAAAQAIGSFDVPQQARLVVLVAFYGLVRVGRWWRNVKPPEPKAQRAKE
jgi:molecular chaperone DnaK